MDTREPYDGPTAARRAQEHMREGYLGGPGAEPDVGGWQTRIVLPLR